MEQETLLECLLRGRIQEPSLMVMAAGYIVPDHHLCSRLLNLSPPPQTELKD